MAISMTFDERSGPSTTGEAGPASAAVATVSPVRASTRVRADQIEGVWQRHYQDVYRYALTLTRSHEDAQEIVSDVFARALDRWSTVPEPPLPWLLVVARRLATDRWRRARRLASILVSARRRTASDDDHDRTEFWSWFDSLSRAMTARQLEALTLRYRNDLSDEQVGEIMGLTASGVRSLVARALDALRSHPEVL